MGYEETVQILFELIDETKRNADSIQKNLKAIQGEAKKSEDSFKKFAIAMVAINQGIDVLQKVGDAAKKAFEFAKEGAQIEQMSRSWDGLVNRLDVTPRILDEMTRASRGTIAEFDLQASTTTLLAGANDQLAKAMLEASPQLVEIAKAANKLNPALGDTTFLYESIAKGIKRAQPLILDNLGITLKIGEVYDDFADSLGRTADELTNDERAMAILHATVEQGGQIISQAGGNVDALTDSFSKLETEGTEALQRLKTEAWKLSEGPLKDIGDTFYWLNRLADAKDYLEDLGLTADDLADKLDLKGGSVSDIFGVEETATLIAYADHLDNLQEQYTKVAETSATMRIEQSLAHAESIEGADAIAALGVAAELTDDQLNDLKDQVKALKDQGTINIDLDMSGEAQSVFEQAQKMALGAGGLQGLTARVEADIVAAGGMTPELQDALMQGTALDLAMNVSLGEENFYEARDKLKEAFSLTSEEARELLQPMIDGLGESGKGFAESAIADIQEGLTLFEGFTFADWEYAPFAASMGGLREDSEIIKRQFDEMPASAQGAYGSVDELLKDGLNPAYLAAKGMLDALDGLDGRRIEIFVDYVTSGTPPSGPQGHQLGGFVMPGEEIIGGEGHAELFRPSVSGNIVPNPGSFPMGGGGVADARTSEQLDTQTQLLMQVLEAIKSLGTSHDMGQAVKEAVQFL